MHDVNPSGMTEPIPICWHAAVPVGIRPKLWNRVHSFRRAPRPRIFGRAVRPGACPVGLVVLTCFFYASHLLLLCLATGAAGCSRPAAELVTGYFLLFIGVLDGSFFRPCLCATRVLFRCARAARPSVFRPLNHGKHSVAFLFSAFVHGFFRCLGGVDRGKNHSSFPSVVASSLEEAAWATRIFVPEYFSSRQRLTSVRRRKEV